MGCCTSRDRYADAGEWEEPVTRAAGPRKPLGVHVSVLQLFFKHHAALTMAELCEKAIKPVTILQACAYIDTLGLDTAEDDVDLGSRTPFGRSRIAPATCFVSHTWQTKFSDVMECIQQHERAFPNTYYWFAVLSTNQHAQIEKPLEWATAALPETIRVAGNMLLVAAPYSAPTALTRAWCLFEAHVAIRAGVHCAVRFPGSQRDDLKQAILDDYFMATARLAFINLEKAESASASDRDLIIEVSRASDGGIPAVNNSIKWHARRWYLQAFVSMAIDAEDAQFVQGLALALGQYGTDADDIITQCNAMLQKVEGRPDGKGPSRLFLASLHHLLGAAQSLGSHHKDAVTTLTKALELTLAALVETNATSNLDVAGTYVTLGAAYHGTGDFARAGEYYNKAAAILVDTLGATHRRVADLHDRKAALLLDSGDISAARELTEKALAVYESACGAFHPSTARARAAMGHVHLRSQDTSRAIECFQAALAVQQATLGETHPDTGATLSAMGTTYLTTGDHAKALGYYDRALAISLATVGATHPTTAQLYGSIALAHRLQGNLDRALEFHLKDLEIKQTTIGEVHRDTAKTYAACAGLYLLRGDGGRALELYRRAVASSMAALGDSHPETGKVLGSLAGVMVAKGIHHEALQCYEQALGIAIASGGEGPDAAALLSAIGRIHLILGHTDEALAPLNKALTLCRTHLGENHAETGRVFSTLGGAYASQGDFDHALECYGRALEIQLAILGEKPDPEIGRLYSAMGMACVSKGDYEKALELHGRDLAIKLQTVGENDPSTATACNSVGHVLEQRGDRANARNMYSRALNVFLFAFGSQHPQTIECQQNVDRVTG
eukprot:m.249416 g.249416  ORF g.249416 m.249416 type:complete len:846 (+) comp16132_c0_seq1:67-2604(+)